jgi:hypothetical protein
MKKPTPELRLERLLEKLSADLAEASDAELLEACADLGIKPAMKGSIAFFGLKSPFFFAYVPEKLTSQTDSNFNANGEDGSDLTRPQ